MVKSKILWHVENLIYELGKLGLSVPQLYIMGKVI